MRKFWPFLVFLLFVATWWWWEGILLGAPMERIAWFLLHVLPFLVAAGVLASIIGHLWGQGQRNKWK